jgi:hypothetical protein
VRRLELLCHLCCLLKMNTKVSFFHRCKNLYEQFP